MKIPADGIINWYFFVQAAHLAYARCTDLVTARERDVDKEGNRNLNVIIRRENDFGLIFLM